VGLVGDGSGEHQRKRLGYRSCGWEHDYFGSAGERERQHEADDSVGTVGDHDNFVA
jgi:hypothetical protein